MRAGALLRRGPWIDVALLSAARAGYAARGFVYLGVGLVAALAAGQLRPAPSGARAAMVPLAEAPLGALWLSLIAAGLCGFALWRALQCLFDADRQGRSPKALFKRAGQGLSGLGYGVLAASMTELIDELGDLREVDDRAEVLATARMVMALPYGQGVLMVGGLFVVGLGALNVLHGFDRRFQSDLDCSVKFKRWAGAVGRIGYISRGLAFGLMGFYALRAGVTLRAADVKDLGGALEALKQQPGGPAMLAAMAAGLMAFGLFGLIEARYRALRAPRHFLPQKGAA